MKDLTGQVFGTIKVLGYSHKDKWYNNYWNCRCQICNSNFVKTNGGLRKHCKICLESKSKKHGMYGTRLYSIWQNMKRRCYNNNCQEYHNYGSRGIKVCESWNDFNNFYKWANKTGYKEILEIDRIDVNGDYRPENCRWVTKRKNLNNKRNNIYFVVGGAKKTLFELAREYNINYGTLRMRLKRGIGIEEALKKEVDKKCRPKKITEYSISGITKTLYDWCEIFKISHTSVRTRMKKGASLLEALEVKNG
jgi:hypothetical protein